VSEQAPATQLTALGTTPKRIVQSTSQPPQRVAVSTATHVPLQRISPLSHPAESGGTGTSRTTTSTSRTSIVTAPSRVLTSFTTTSGSEEIRCGSAHPASAAITPSAAIERVPSRTARARITIVRLYPDRRYGIYTIVSFGRRLAVVDSLDASPRPLSAIQLLICTP
jgi:hypothetical protein